MKLTKQFDELVGKLPEALPSRKEHLRLILELQERALKGRQELEAELVLTSMHLQHVQQLFAQLADDRLQVGSRGAAATDHPS